MSSLPTPKSPISASPKDLIRFLVWKDSKGKTKIHVPSCPNFGSHSKRKCSCPSRLAAGTVDSTIGKLRSIFNSLGRSGVWSGLSPGNPAAHPSVKKYLASISEEQAKARVSPRQAVPFFFDKFSKLCYYLRKQTFLPSISPLERYIVSRDLAFFCLDFYSGDRASDLGRVYTKEVLLLPGKQGLLFHHKFGKTLRGKDSNVFAVKKCPHDSIVCPVVNLTTYVKLADLMNIKLREGFLFRATDPKGRVSTKPFLGSTVANRLRLHLTTLKIHEGETMHSFRSGCSIEQPYPSLVPQMTKWLNTLDGKACRRLNIILKSPKLWSCRSRLLFLPRALLKGGIIFPLQNRWGPSFELVIISKDFPSLSLETLYLFSLI